MKLIDADKLILNLNDWAFSEAPDERHEGTERLIRQTRYDTIQECMRAVEEQPSAERNGKWVNHRNDDGHNIADCNLCGSTLQWFDNDGEHNYCPNCGAKMEGEEE